MTADVPPGPARKAGEGIATLAAMSGRPVVPFAIATRRYIALPTWSAFTVNLPFSTLAIVIGDPVRVTGDDAHALQTGRLAIERALAEVTARAYALAGASDPLNRQRRRQARAVAQSVPGVHQPRRAARALDPFLAHAPRQGGARPAPRALWRVERAAPVRLPRLVPRGERRRGQCRAAGDRHHRRPAPGGEAPAHHRHRHLRQARARAAAQGRAPSICAARQSGLCAALLAPLAPRSRRAGRVGDLAEPRARDQGRGHSPPPHQRPHVHLLLPALAAAPRHEPAAVLLLRPRARAERPPRRALHPARRRARARCRQSQGRRPSPARRPSGQAAACRCAVGAHGAARCEHASGRGGHHRLSPSQDEARAERPSHHHRAAASRARDR